MYSMFILSVNSVLGAERFYERHQCSCKMFPPICHCQKCLFRFPGIVSHSLTIPLFHNAAVYAATFIVNKPAVCPIVSDVAEVVITQQNTVNNYLFCSFHMHCSFKAVLIVMYISVPYWCHPLITLFQGYFNSFTTKNSFSAIQNHE